MFDTRNNLHQLYSKNIREFVEAGRSLTAEDISKFAKDSNNIKHNVTLANIDFHNRTADGYENDFSTCGIRSGPSEQRIKSELARLCHNYPHGNYLDIGCGTGRMLSFASELFKNSLGLDISQGMLELALKRNLNVILADAYNLPIASNSFDVATIFSTIHHVPDPENLIIEAIRILKPGGTLYIDLEPNSNAYKIVKSTFYRSVPIVRKLFEREARVGEVKSIPSYELAEYFHTVESGIDSSILQQRVTAKTKCKFEIFYVDANNLEQHYKISFTMLLFYLAHFKFGLVFRPEYSRYLAFRITKNP
jgi:ubiquinone/menaquinone biosynthesis C-methylase UbiE